jgi:hypothetical protein
MALCGAPATAPERPLWSGEHRRNGPSRSAGGGRTEAFSRRGHYIFRLPRPRSRAIASTVVAPPGWTIKDAEKLYNMSGWGQGYFRVNPEGHVTVHPDANRKRGLDLYR